jgi:hypothetical protein
MNRALLLSLACLVLWGCGPEQTSKSKEDAQIAEDIAAQRNLFRPLAGRYRGTLTLGNGERRDAMLVLVEVDVPAQNAGRNQTSVVPTLQGSLSYCSVPGTCFEGDDTNRVFIGTMNNASYDPASGHLTLFWDASRSASSTNAGTFQIDGVLKSNHFKANCTTGDEPDAGVLDVTRAQK